MRATYETILSVVAAHLHGHGMHEWSDLQPRPTAQANALAQGF